MRGVAHYVGRPTHRGWHTNARVYLLDPPLLGASGGYLIEITNIVVSGIKELTPIECEGMPVYRLNTVVSTVDESIGIFDGWVRGSIDHVAALEQLGYIMEGKP